MSVTRIQNTGECLVVSTQRASNNHQPDNSFLEDAARAPQTKISAGCHDANVGVQVKCAAASAEFYQEVLGMKIHWR